MPWRQSCSLIDAALEREAARVRTQENIAMLLDRDNFWLEAEYVQWITDPEDPTVKANAARRRARGIMPPDRPLLVPVALRSPERMAELMAAYQVEAARHATPRVERTLTVAEAIKMMRGG